MFYLFRDESNLKIDNALSYCTKLKQPGVVDIIHQNKALIKSCSKLVDTTFAKLRMGLVPNWDPFLQKKNDNVQHELSETKHDEHERVGITLGINMKEINVTILIICQVRSELQFLMITT